MWHMGWTLHRVLRFSRVPDTTLLVVRIIDSVDFVVLWASLRIKRVSQETLGDKQWSGMVVFQCDSRTQSHRRRAQPSYCVFVLMSYFQLLCIIISFFFTSVTWTWSKYIPGHWLCGNVTEIDWPYKYFSSPIFMQNEKKIAGNLMV